MPLKRGSPLGAVHRSLLVEISGRLYLHMTTEQRSHGSHRSLSMQEALLSIREARQSGRPYDKDTVIRWKPVQAGGHIENNWEARQCGRPTSRIYMDMDTAKLHTKTFVTTPTRFHTPQNAGNHGNGDPSMGGKNARSNTEVKTMLSFI